MKEKAKKKPIMDLFPNPLKKVGATIWQGKCPFHDDQGHPNCTIYPQTNSFFCFACNKGGDVITFYMLLKKCDFNRAIKELS
jgi:DNA primase